MMPANLRRWLNLPENTASVHRQGGTAVPPVAQVASELPRFALDKRALSKVEQAYLDYYALDFSIEFPSSQYSLGTLPSGEHCLALQVWQSADASGTLLLVHGYFDHVGLLHHLIRFGLQRNYNVVAFDLPGHGLSSGERASIEDFADYRRAIADVRAATGVLPGPWCLLGQSTGGAAIMDYLSVDAAVWVERTVLLAPLVRPCDWALVSFAHTLIKPFTRSIRRRFAKNSNDAEFLAFLQLDPLQPKAISTLWLSALKDWLKEFLARPPCACPMLVIQGDDDGTVDWKYNLPQIQRLFPCARVYMLAGGRHHLANESASLRAYYLQQIAAYLDAELP